MLLAAGAAVAALALACVGGLVWLGTQAVGERAAPGGPVSLAVDSDGPDWTYAELLEHLRAKGLQLRVRPAGGHQLYALVRTEEEMTEVYWHSNNQNDGWRMQGIFLLDPRAVRWSLFWSIAGPHSRRSRPIRSLHDGRRGGGTTGPELIAQGPH